MISALETVEFSSQQHPAFSAAAYGWDCSVCKTPITPETMSKLFKDFWPQATE